MQELKPSYSASIDQHHGELHFATGGLFAVEDMKKFQALLVKTVGPFIEQRRTFRALGDLSEYVTQTREVGEMMRETLENGEKFGVDRTAIVIASATLKLQYKRVSAGRNLQIFDNRFEALEWLRSSESA